MHDVPLIAAGIPLLRERLCPPLGVPSPSHQHVIAFWHPKVIGPSHPSKRRLRRRNLRRLPASSSIGRNFHTRHRAFAAPRRSDNLRPDIRNNRFDLKFFDRTHLLRRYRLARLNSFTWMAIPGFHKETVEVMI